jgi:hypothetical protein
MKRFSMLARHVIGLLALALAVLTFGSGSLVATTSGHSSGGDKGKVVAGTAEGKMRSIVQGTAKNGRDVKAGKFTPESFAIDENGELTVTGTFTGVVPGKGRFSSVETTTVESVNGVPANGSSAEAMQLSSNHGCDVLNLVLGPLDLDVLGLVVQLNQVELDIIAEPGSGNLLGNLLCQVAGLLDQGSPLEDLLGQLTGLLNDILGSLLGGLGGV